MPDDFASMFNAAKAQHQAEVDAATQPADLAGTLPFRALGHDRGRYYFLPDAGGQVVALSARDMASPGALLQLAPLLTLEMEYAGRQGFDPRRAADALMRACHARGIYNPDAIRGRGLWMDDGRRVLHLGDHLLVDGMPTAIKQHRSAYIYEAAPPLAVTLGPPLSDVEARRFLAMCCAVSWRDPDRDGRLLAGWIVSAMIGGALAWRPHLWLSAEGGDGKTWVEDNLISPALGPLALRLQGKTTEAGVRGAVQHDARPVLFDEAETQSDHDRARMQMVIDLARQASSEHSAPIVKGTKEGGSRSFTMRCSFAFASINVGLTQAADESRFAVLSLVPGNSDQFKALKQAQAEATVENLNGRLLARLMHLAPTIRANADLLADAIARTGAGRRAGDTLGTLIACQMALVDSVALTAEQAAALVKERDWVREAAAEARPAPEWDRALKHFVQAEVVRRSVGGQQEGLTLSELIAASLGRMDSMTGRDADAAMSRIGVRVHQGRLLLGNRSSWISQRFAGTPWNAAWASTIARAPGAQRSVAVRFSAAYQDRAVSIPLDLLIGPAP